MVELLIVECFQSSVRSEITLFIRIVKMISKYNSLIQKSFAYEKVVSVHFAAMLTISFGTG